MGDADQLRDRDKGLNGRVDAASLLPMVEIYETIEGEGTFAGYPTVFVRIFGCNLRCTWCDTPYSYAPAKAEQMMSISEIVARAESFNARRLCLTGGEPLLYAETSLTLLQALADSSKFVDIHVETNGAIEIQPFIKGVLSPHVRYIMDYKLKGSEENSRMLDSNIRQLREIDELKFVIANEEDFFEAIAVLNQHPCRATIIFSPVWETMPPRQLAHLILQHSLTNVRMSLQLHKLIWGVDERGV